MESIIEAAKGSGVSKGIPKVTSYDKEKSKSSSKTFKASMFMITCDEDAAVYADFMNDLIKNNSELLREESSWNQHGELMKFIEYMEND